MNTSSNSNQNVTLERNPRKLKWTKSFRKAHGKEMSVDSTLIFAARRNVPVRYNRDLVATTLKAMQRVAEIRTKRERVFYRKRMAGNRERQMADDRKLVEENQHLLPPAERTVPLYAVEEEEDIALEEVMEEELDSDIEMEEEELVAAKIRSRAPKVKQKREMLRGGGTKGS
jgi:large subunit ribosomal protein L24e